MIIFMGIYMYVQDRSDMGRLNNFFFFFCNYAVLVTDPQTEITVALTVKM